MNTTSNHAALFFVLAEQNGYTRKQLPRVISLIRFFTLSLWNLPGLLTYGFTYGQEMERARSDAKAAPACQLRTANAGTDRSRACPPSGTVMSERHDIIEPAQWHQRDDKREPVLDRNYDSPRVVRYIGWRRACGREH